MDQLKTQLAVIGKHGFWISSVLVLLVSLGCWYWSTTTLQKENESQTSMINSNITSVKSVQDDLHKIPNDLSHQEMEKLISKRRGEVLKSWEKLYDRQKDILVWPTNTFNDRFLNEFIKKDGTVKLPFEHYVKFPTEDKDELATTLRRQYANYISNTLPKLAAVAGTEWTADFDQKSGLGMGMEMGGAEGRTGIGPNSGIEVDVTGASTEPLVKWSSTSQSAVLGDLFPWRPETPKTLEIYYSQENLWILRQLLEIISDVNGDAEQSYQAKIHEIVQIAIGKSVSTTPGNISKPGETAGADGGMGMGMEGMPDMDMGMGDMGDMGGMGGGPGGSTDVKDPAENRYLNVKNEPIAGATLRNALESNQPNDASLAVAKRVPVMMKLNMNQTAVHELVALCGSADLMVEVHQVRVLPQNSAGGGMGDMDGGGGEMDMDMDMGGGGPGDMGPGGMGSGGGAGFPGGGADDSEFPLDMSVEIYGIIYIYNPPDAGKLADEQVTEDTIIDGV
ncbi:hypothetical protein N9F76_01595, partial [bacterium]|nr:hypothetical protein [bacterium]